MAPRVHEKHMEAGEHVIRARLRGRQGSEERPLPGHRLVRYPAVNFIVRRPEPPNREIITLQTITFER